MAFVNEAIPEQDKQKVNALVNYQTISAIQRWGSQFNMPVWWTVDRERDAYLLNLSAGGPPDSGQMPFSVLVIEGQIVFFSIVGKGTGDDVIGLNKIKEIYNLHIPQTLESRREEIKQLIKEALKENEYFRPFADGGTIANPNMKARWNIASFSVEFK